jgi:hypothetical protein
MEGISKPPFITVSKNVQKKTIFSADSNIVSRQRGILGWYARFLPPFLY